MPRTRSCKDLSASETQLRIDFPQKKTGTASIAVLGGKLKKKNDEDENTEVVKKDNNTEKLLSPKKRLAQNNDENAASPHKSPKKDILSPYKSPLADRSNLQIATPPSVKRKLMMHGKTDTCYTKIRQALHTSIPKQLVSRRKELDTIHKFIDMTIIQSKPGSMYMSGAPGTGKTACLTKVLEEIKCKSCKKLQTVFLNCMSLRFSQSIFTKLVNEWNGTYLPAKEAIKCLEKKFTSKGPRILLVLDEIDQLESKNQEVLYKLFEMPFLAKSRLVLIGIANALDLTDRVLPRLQAKDSCKPLLLQFPPYTKDEITSILHERVKETNSNVIDPSAIQFCSRKVSAMSGDVRKALDILRRAVEVVESESRKQSIASPLSTKKDVSQKQKITIAHISSVCSEVYGSRISCSDGSNVAFPLQQKIVVCTFMVCCKDKKIKEVTSGKLYESYCRVCKSRQINQVSQEEFIGLCTLLESQGIITVKRTKDVRSNKISLRLQENEIEHALQDKTLMSAILANGIPS